MQLLRSIIATLATVAVAHAGRLRNTFNADESNFVELADSVHADLTRSLLSLDGSTTQTPPHHVPGGRYDPDMTLHSYLHVDEGNEHKVEGIGDMLATGTAEMLHAMFEHHGLSHKLTNLAHLNTDITTSFIDVSHLQQHGLSHHELSTVHAVAGAMNERIFAKLRAGSSRKKDEKSAKCPTQPELENGGNSLIADAVSSDKDASAKYVTTPVVPTNYDPSAIDIPDATQPNKWHDLQTLTLADETQRKAAKLLETYSDVTSAKFRKLSNILSRSNAEQAHEVIESLTSGLDVGLGNDEEDDRILIKFDEAARKVRIFVYFHCTLILYLLQYYCTTHSILFILFD